LSLYKKQFVLFLDILGWGQLITDTSDNYQIHEHLNSILNKIKEISDAQLEASETINTVFPDRFKECGKATVKSIHFSDSLVLSFDDNLTSFSQVFGTVSGLSYLLAEHGYFIRGGLDFGKIHHKESVIFGPALNESYRLESKIALSPRIAISDSAMEVIEHLQIPESFIFKDEDFTCLNNLSSISKVNNILKIIDSRLVEFEENEHILKKYKWLFNQISKLL